MTTAAATKVSGAGKAETASTPAVPLRPSAPLPETEMDALLLGRTGVRET